MTDTHSATVNLFQAVCDNATDRMIVVDPPWPVLETLERVLDGQDGPPRRTASSRRRGGINR